MVSRRKQALDHLRSRYPLDCNTLSMMFGAKVLILQQIKVGYPQLLDQFCVGWPQFRLNCRTGYFTSVKDCWGTHTYVWSPTQWKTLTCLFLKTIIPKYSGVATHQSLIEVKWRAINVISCNYSGWNILMGAKVIWHKFHSLHKVDKIVDIKSYLAQKLKTLTQVVWAVFAPALPASSWTHSMIYCTSAKVHSSHEVLFWKF